MGKRWKQCQTLFWGGSKITADGDCSHEIKRHLLLERKVMTNLDSMLKSRDITLPTKVRLVKAMVFPVVMYGCESWTVKKAERWRIDAFELWYWRRLLRLPWTARRSNKSILNVINPECSLEGLMLKVLWPPDAKSWLNGKKPLCWERWKAGGEGDDRGWDDWMASPTQWTWVWVNSGSWWWTGRPGVLQSMRSQRFGHDWVTELIALSPFFFPLATSCLFSASIIMFLFRYVCSFFCFCFLDSTFKWNHTVFSSSVWLSSLSIITSWSISFCNKWLDFIHFCRYIY